jgi:hypothetical protein
VESAVVLGSVVVDAVVGEEPPTFVVIPQEVRAEATATINSVGTGRSQLDPSTCACCHVELQSSTPSEY